MLMLIIMSWGKDLLIQPVDSLEEARDLRRRIGGDRDFIIYESHFLIPVRLDRAWRQLGEEEMIEWLNTEAYPRLHEEGRISRRNGKYVRNPTNVV